MSDSMEPLWTSETTSAYLGIPPRTLDQWAYQGTGPRNARIGKHRRYDPADVRAWVETQKSRFDAVAAVDVE